MRTTVSILMLFASMFLAFAVPTSSAGPRSWKIMAGGYVEAQALQAEKFLPGSITINEGDSVTWALGGNAHTIYIPGTAKVPDLVVPGKSKGELLFNSVFYYATGKAYDGSGPFSAGALEPGFRTSTTVTFTKAGKYKYVCAFHPGMEGTVVVQPAGSAYPKTQAQYDLLAQQQAQSAFGAGRSLLRKNSAGSIREASGKVRYTITILGSNDSRFNSLRFQPDNLRIKAGDTVTWKTADPTDIHTVTFLSGRKTPDLELFQANKTVIANPIVMNPAGGHVYAGQGYFNSGILDPTDPQAPHEYSLTFTTLGRFEYVCVVHDEFGMKGTITVTK